MGDTTTIQETNVKVLWIQTESVSWYTKLIWNGRHFMKWNEMNAKKT